MIGSSHVSQLQRKELPQIPPFRNTQGSSSKRELIQGRKKNNPQVRFSLPANILFERTNHGNDDNHDDDNDLESEISPVSSTQYDLNTYSASSPTINTHAIQQKHHKNSSSVSLPTFTKRSRRGNSMFMLETTSHQLAKDTHDAFVRPKDTSHFKISIPLVIRTPPKLSKVRAKGDELLDKEMVFNGTEYELIEVIDDGDDIDADEDNNDSELVILRENRKRASEGGSPLRQPPINRSDNAGGSKENVPQHKIIKPPKMSVAKPMSPLKSALKPYKPNHEEVIAIQERSGFTGDSGNTHQTHHAHHENNQAQIYKGREEYRYPPQNNQHTNTQTEKHRSAPELSSYQKSQFPGADAYQFPAQRQPALDIYNLPTENPYKDMSFRYASSATDETRTPNSPLEQNTALSFPSLEAKKMAREEHLKLDQQHYNAEDYTTTVSNTHVPNAKKVLAQSPRRHNHTRSKSQINIFTEFDEPLEQQVATTTVQKSHGHSRSRSQHNILADLEGTSMSAQSHQHSKSKSQSNILTQLEPVRHERNMYTQTGPVSEIIIPELSNVPLPPQDAEKANSKLEFYLKDQFDRNNIREEFTNAIESPFEGRMQLLRRPNSPLNSHSSHETELSLGRTNSTAATSVYSEVMIDLTVDNQEVVITRDKLKGSISSYRSVRQKNKDGEEVDLVLVDENDDDALDLIDQYADDFKVHDSIKRKESVVSNNEDLERVYSMYHKFGKNSIRRDNFVLPPRRSLLKESNQRIFSTESTMSTNSFQAGDENQLIIGNIHDWRSNRSGPLESLMEGISLEDRKNRNSPTMAASSKLRQRYLTKKSQVSRSASNTSVVISEPSSLRSTNEVLNPISNLFNSRARIEARLHQEQFRKPKAGEMTKENKDYLDYNNSKYDFDSFLASR